MSKVGSNRQSKVPTNATGKGAKQDSKCVGNGRSAQNSIPSGGKLNKGA